MSKTKHTPEPWDAYESTLDGVSWLSISKAGLSIDDEVPVVCMVTKIESLNKTDVENARRIVLCVNACKNLSNGELDDLIHLDGLSLNMLEKTRQQRDTAWKELREIREAIKADENESTADEVRSLVAKYDAAHRTLEDHGPEGHNVTNQQYVDLRYKWIEMKDRLSALEEERDKWKQVATMRENRASVLDARRDHLMIRLTKLEKIATAVEVDITAGRPLEYHVEELRAELIHARKALGILAEQEQTTTLGMEQTP